MSVCVCVCVCVCVNVNTKHVAPAVFLPQIADLGLATCQSWSKLTREESRRKSRSGCTVGTRGAGTLSYMAPEHLNDINARSTEKSDVYSFAIVLWVILACQEPYESEFAEI